MTDQAVRDAALLVDRHLLLQAPAGSGKTTVLAQRFLAALAQVDEPEEVLAITFTRKAAAEMRERVLVALEGRWGVQQPDRATWEALRAAALNQATRRGWLLEELPTRLRIQTIDSLCHEIARAMPLLGRMHQQLDVVDDASAAFLEAAGQCLRTADEEGDFQPDADRLLRRLDNDWDRAQRLLADLLPSRNRWLPVLLAVPPEQLGARVAASLARIVTDTLHELHAVMPEELRNEATALARHSAQHRRESARGGGAWQCWLEPGTQLIPIAAQLVAWRAVGGLALKDDDDWRAVVNVNHGFPPDDKVLKQRWKSWIEALQRVPGLAPRLRAVMALPSAVVDAEESAALATLSRLLLLCAALLKLEFQRRGQVDHSEVAAVARQALREMGTPTELSIRQTLRVRHLLVDEFQDTSPDQLDLVRELTQGWDGARSLFLVGDPMQSIYLFRNSEVGLFLRTRAEGVHQIQLQALQLTRNFRSLPPLVAWVNAAFARIFPRTEDIRSSAVTFLAAEAARAGDPAEKTVHILPQGDAAAEPEAKAIAAQILALRAAHPDWRIAVLVQTRTVAPPVLDALGEQSIPVLGIELAPLAERQVVRELVALGQALLHAGDRTAWLAVLHAPCCGLSLQDLHALCGDDPTALLVDRLADPRYWVASGEGVQRRLQRIAPVLLRGWQERGHADLASVIERLWRELGGWQACRDAGERSAAMQYLGALRRMIEREGAPVDGAKLQQLAQNLRDHGSSSGENPVEVLTIHHSKGLEWDAVFLPGLGRIARADQPPLLRWLELPASGGETDLLLAVRSIGAAAGADPLARFIAGLQRQRQDNERVRLAYVAVTRARHRLYLSGHAPWNRTQQRRIPRQRSLLQILWPAVSEEFEALPAPPEQPAVATAERLRLDTPWYQLAERFEHTAWRKPLAVSSLSGGAVPPQPAPEYDWVGPLARATGTLVHAELERFALQGMPAPDELPQRAPLYVSRLRESGLGVGPAKEAADRVVARLQQVVQQPRVHWLLAAAHREARSEWRLSGVVDGALRNVVIDRSFVDEQGHRWVIDFKTSSHSGGGLEQFLASELERYRPQLTVYQQLASRTGPEPVRAALYFPWLDEFRELGAAAG